jgi:hypothetical protein
MKRALRSFIMLGLLLPGLAPAQTAKITAVVLEVKWRASATAAWSRASVGRQLAAGAQVRTGKRSKCEIKFPDGSMVRLAPQSDLTIAQVQGKNLSMGYGKLYARIVSGTTARIQGGTGVASIKGTTLEFDAGLPGVPPDQQPNTLTIFGGSAQLSGPGAPPDGQPVGGGYQSSVGPGAPAGLNGVPPEGFFGGGGAGGWWEGVQSGFNTMTTAGTYTGTELKEQTLDTGRNPALHTPGYTDPVSNMGNIKLDISSVGTAGLRTPAPANASVALPSTSALFDVQPISLRVDPPLERFGKRVFGPDTFVDVFGLATTEGSLAGVRVRPHVLWKNIYFEVGGTGWTDFDGFHGILSEAFAKARPPCGDIIVGRQHFLAGPVNNTNLGTIIGFNTADAIRWQPRVRDVRLDVAYVHDFVPHRSGRVGGWYGRAEANVWRGVVGLNVVNFESIGTGISADVSVPIIPGMWDFYGEFGQDQFDNTVQTWGFYFPDLYQRYDLDLFLEYANRGGVRESWSLNAYREFEHDWTGFLTLQASPGNDTVAGLGVIKRFN